MKRARRFTRYVAVLSLAACADKSTTPATEIVVAVSADPLLAKSLTALRVSTFSPAASATKAKGTHMFQLVSDEPRAGEVRIPFSFGLRADDATKVRVVIEGFADDSDEPVFETKVITKFERAQTLLLPIALSDACFSPDAMCTADDQTCNPAQAQDDGVGSCDGLPELTLSQVAPGAELPAVMELPPAEPEPLAISDAGDAGDAGAPLQAACPEDNSCVFSDYACAPAAHYGYTCQGNLADWPMPDNAPGAAHPFEYDLSEQDVVIDRVTGLVWQRALPASYTGCSGNFQRANDSCTQDEARAYCAKLKLGARKWRLPSQVEMASLLDLTQPTLKPTWDPSAFGDTLPDLELWTGTTVVDWSGEGILSKEPRAVLFNFMQASALAELRSERKFVRCVSEGKVPEGLPSDRYQVHSADGTVTDTRTMLTWRIAPLIATADWQAAQKLCPALGNGFRTASYKELLTLVDLTTTFPAMASLFRGPEKFTVCWSSSSMPSTGGLQVDFFGGSSWSEQIVKLMHEKDPTYPAAYHVRCVR